MRHIISEPSDENGGAKPMVNSVTPAMPPTIMTNGMRIKKVVSRECAIENTDLLQLVKNALKLKIKATSTQSREYVLR